MEEGKDEVMAQGFTSGYRDGMEASVRWGRLQGRLRYCMWLMKYCVAELIGCLYMQCSRSTLEEGRPACK